MPRNFYEFYLYNTVSVRATNAILFYLWARLIISSTEKKELRVRGPYEPPYITYYYIHSLLRDHDTERNVWSNRGAIIRLIICIMYRLQ